MHETKEKQISQERDKNYENVLSLQEFLHKKYHCWYC